MAQAMVDDQIGRFVDRRTTALKILRRLLNHELELSREKEIVLDRAILEEAAATVDMFLEDFSKQYQQQAAVVVAERKMVEPSKQTAARVN